MYIFKIIFSGTQNYSSTFKSPKLENFKLYKLVNTISSIPLLKPKLLFLSALHKSTPVFH